MKLRFFFWTVALIAALTLTACASTPPSATVDKPTPTVISSTVTAAVTPNSVPVQAVATSRGPNLEATDPTSVKLASGNLQLVEFFRFT